MLGDGFGGDAAGFKDGHGRALSRVCKRRLACDERLLSAWANSGNGSRRAARAGDRRHHMPKPIPEGYHSVTPYLVVDDANAAIKFYERAFGATEKFRMPMGDRVGHAELQIGDSVVMLADEFPDMGHLGPKSRGGPTSSILLYVEDVDTAFNKAINAGRRSSGRWRTSSGATAWALCRIRSATNGASPPMSRKCRRKKCSGGWSSSAPPEAAGAGLIAQMKTAPDRSGAVPFRIGGGLSLAALSVVGDRSGLRVARERGAFAERRLSCRPRCGPSSRARCRPTASRRRSGCCPCSGTPCWPGSMAEA